MRNRSTFSLCGNAALLTKSIDANQAQKQNQTEAAGKSFQNALFCGLQSFTDQHENEKFQPIVASRYSFFNPITGAELSLINWLSRGMSVSFNFLNLVNSASAWLLRSAKTSFTCLLGACMPLLAASNTPLILSFNLIG